MPDEGQNSQSETEELAELKEQVRRILRELLAEHVPKQTGSTGATASLPETPHSETTRTIAGPPATPYVETITRVYGLPAAETPPTQPATLREFPCTCNCDPEDEDMWLPDDVEELIRQIQGRLGGSRESIIARARNDYRREQIENNIRRFAQKLEELNEQN